MSTSPTRRFSTTSDRGLTEAESREIVARAATLDERMSEVFEPVHPPSHPPGANSSERVGRLFRRWSELAARGDHEQLRHRLRWDGWDEKAVFAALGGVKMSSDQSLPEWARLLGGASSRAAHSAPREGALLLDSTDPLPFEEVLEPFVRVACQDLFKHRDPLLLTRSAETQLGRDLLRQLVSIAGEALYVRFTATHMRSRSPIDRVLAAADPGARPVYDAFVQELLTNSLAPLFRDLPVLARILAQTALLWRDAVGEMLDRLSRDRQRIAGLFSDGPLPGPVTSIEPSLSDPHHGRRRVMALTFASGLKVVYKPKSLATDEAYGALLAWLNNRGAPLPFRIPSVLNCGEYGWQEYFERRPCADAEEARRYSMRGGMLLALLHALEATDCYRDTLVAHGEYPVLIDTQTLMNHRLRADQWEDARDQEVAEALPGDSVLRIGLLAAWNVHGDQQIAYDVSGLGRAAGKVVPFPHHEWSAMNTDAMRLRYTSVSVPAGAHQAALHDDPLSLDAYVEEVQMGFSEMYRLLMAHRAELLQEGSPLFDLASQPVRCTVRHTRVYSDVLRKLRGPAHLHDGADWSVELEELTRAAMPASGDARAIGSPPRTWPVYRAERAAITRGDIPSFTARPVSDSLQLDGEVVAHCFEEPSFARVNQRFLDMDESALEKESGFLRAAVHCGNVREPPTGSAGPHGLEAATTLTRDELITEALKIAGEIESHALVGSDGGATWVVPHYLIQAMRYQLAPADLSLYGGTPGIAIFLAAAASVTGERRFRELALAALHPLRQSLRKEGPVAGRFLTPGAGDGIGSFCYALTRAGTLLDEPELLRDARDFALLLTHRQIDEDNALDVISGVAGEILGILPLYELSGHDALLDRAIACGRRLLATRQHVSPAMAAWPTMHGKLLSGFAHGAAGGSYALLRLFQFTADRSLLEAANEAIAYEDSTFRAEDNNWLDLRSEPPSFMAGWCHGAPGIGLARAAGLHVTDSPQIRADIDTAITTTIDMGARGIENLCCGPFGRAEILLVLAGRLNRLDLASHALQIASQVVARARQRGRYLFQYGMPAGLHDPGFFQGTAGVGYTLLRLAYPDQLPSVLLFE